MRFTWIALSVIALLPTAAVAQSYGAVNHLDVVPLGPATFEVIEARGEGPRGIWCAAADYAERRLRATGRIYIREARGPAKSAPGRKSVVFTTDPQSLPQGPFRSLTLDTSQVGVGLPIGHAIQFCHPDEDEFGLGNHLLRRR